MIDKLKQELTDIESQLQELNSKISELVEEREMLDSARFQKMSDINEELKRQIAEAEKVG